MATFVIPGDGTGGRPVERLINDLIELGISVRAIEALMIEASDDAADILEKIFAQSIYPYYMVDLPATHQPPAQPDPATWQPQPPAADEIEAWSCAINTGGLPQLVHTAIEQAAREISSEPGIEERLAQIESTESLAEFTERVGQEIAGTPAAAPFEKPAESADRTRACLHCGELFTPRRKDMLFCMKRECQAAKRARYSAAYKERKKSGSGSPADPEPSDQDLRAVDAFARQMIAEEPQPLVADVFDQLINADEEQPIAVELPVVVEPEVPVAAAPRKDLKAWLVENGPRQGEHLSSHELAVALQLGDMTPGQELRHVKKGLARVVKVRGQKAQKIRWLYGAQANQLANHNEIA